ncbi:hypothetical protein [Mesorhizobium sp. M8A.F.Ca.ET.182.01.1.1]|uniref:hypothetical protein n=1 Tax=unclassified Mesorhizobium TaxID=325217 RepID=UPI00167B8064
MDSAELRDAGTDLFLSVGNVRRDWWTHQRVLQMLAAFDAADNHPRPIDRIRNPEQIFAAMPRVGGYDGELGSIRQLPEQRRK